MSSVRSASLKPSPSAPSSASCGTRQSANSMRASGCGAITSMRSATVRPVVVRRHDERRDAAGTRSLRSCARRRSRNRRCRRCEIHVLQPSSTQSPPSRTARVVIAATSEPGVGLRQRERGDRPALAHGRQPARLLGVAAGERDRAAAEPLQREREIGETVVVGERLARDAKRARIERRKRAAVRCRNAIAQEARRAERAHERAAAAVDVGVIAAVVERRRRPRAELRRERAVVSRRRTASRDATGRCLVSLELRLLLRDERIVRAAKVGGLHADRLRFAPPPRSRRRDPSPIPDAAASSSSPCANVGPAGERARQRIAPPPRASPPEPRD